MDPIHQQALKKCRVGLVNDIGNPADVCDVLISNNVLSQYMVDCIMVEKTNQAKCRQLLTNLPRRGDSAFDGFVIALRDCHHLHLVELLEKTVSELRGLSTSPSGPITQPTDATASNAAPNAVPMETNL